MFVAGEGRYQISAPGVARTCNVDAMLSGESKEPQWLTAMETMESLSPQRFSYD